MAYENGAPIGKYQVAQEFNDLNICVQVEEEVAPPEITTPAVVEQPVEAHLATLVIER